MWVCLHVHNVTMRKCFIFNDNLVPVYHTSLLNHTDCIMILHHTISSSAGFYNPVKLVPYTFLIKKSLKGNNSVKVFYCEIKEK